MPRPSARITSVLLVVCCAAGACSSLKQGEDGSGNAGGAGSTAGVDGAAGSAASTSNEGPFLTGVDGRLPQGSDSGWTVSTPVAPGEECTGTVFEGEGMPLNMVLMVDRSVSMGDAEPEYLTSSGNRKWDDVRRGFESFVQLPQTHGLSVAMDFFGQGEGETEGNTSCDPELYASPELEMAPLPGAGRDLLSTYDRFSPGQNTPMRAALEGAHLYARRWKDEHNGDVIVVLVTDGLPNGCGDPPRPADEMRLGAARIAEVARAAAAAVEPIPTYFLGIEGVELAPDDFRYVADAIATAGGTTPIIIEADADLAAWFSASLETIRNQAAPPCEYGVPVPPDDEVLDPGRVNVALKTPSGASEGILKVAGPDQCDHGGWYYSAVDGAERIELCPNTCNVVSQLRGFNFEVLFGCATLEQIY